MKDLEKRLEAQKRELEAKNKSFEEKRNKVEQECNELHGGNEIYESPNKDKRSEEQKHMHTVSELIEKEKKNPEWESCLVIQSKCEEMQQKRATRMEQEKDILQRFKAKIYEAEEEALYEKLKSEMILEMAKENFKHFEKNAFEEMYHSLLQSIQMEVELRKKEMLKQFEGELEVDSFRHKEALIKQRKIDVYERMCETIAKEEEIELQNARRKSRRQVKRKKND